MIGGPNLDARDVNRLQRFRDFTGDVGGYVKKDTMWWYGAYRSTVVGQRYAWLLDEAATVKARVQTGKLTYNPTPRDKLIGYIQRQRAESDNHNYSLSAAQPVMTSDALVVLSFPVTVWKADLQLDRDRPAVR